MQHLRVTHRFRPSSQPDLFQVDVTVQNVGFTAATNLHYRRVFDWDVGPSDNIAHVTWGQLPGADDEFIHGTSNDGFANPNPIAPLTDRGSTGYFTDVGPGDYGGLIDIKLGNIGANLSRTFTLYYGISTSETAALSALHAVGAEVYSLGQPDTAEGATLGSPVTAIFGIDGTGLRANPGARTARAATDERAPDGAFSVETEWVHVTSGPSQGAS